MLRLKGYFDCDEISFKHKTNIWPWVVPLQIEERNSCLRVLIKEGETEGEGGVFGRSHECFDSNLCTFNCEHQATYPCLVANSWQTFSENWL